MDDEKLKRLMRAYRAADVAQKKAIKQVSDAEQILQTLRQHQTAANADMAKAKADMHDYVMEDKS